MAFLAFKHARRLAFVLKDDMQVPENTDVSNTKIPWFSIACPSTFQKYSLCNLRIHMHFLPKPLASNCFRVGWYAYQFIITQLLTPVVKVVLQVLTCCQMKIYLDKRKFYFSSHLMDWSYFVITISFTPHIEFLTECNGFSRKRIRSSSFTLHTADSQTRGGR